VLGDHPAIVHDSVTVSYRELYRRAAGLAGYLARAGIIPGDRVGLLLENSLEFAEAVHAVSLAGGVSVPLNLRLTAGELAFQLLDSEPSVVLCHPSTQPLATEAAGQAGLGEVVALPPKSVEPHPHGAPVETHMPGDVHSIIYTSGTTGRPKGAMLSYGNFWASAAASAFNLGLLSGDRWLACMPLFHVGGLSILLRSAMYGTTAVIHARFEEHAVNRALREDGITLLSVVPAMLQRMLDADALPYPDSVRAVLVGGGPVPSQLLTRALDRGLPVVQTYGLTEASSQVATLAPADAASHVGSAGKALVSTGLRIDAAPNEPGEILVRGPTVSPGYWRSEAATAEAFSGGWFHTGDIGRLDGDGYLYVLDRRDDLIVTGGENVYPAEVEAVLLLHPAVSAAAVVGVPDASWGHVVAAALVAAPGAYIDLPALTEWLRSRVAAFKVPQRFLVVDALPATASGKIQRHLARQMFIP
jgi:O-succinylbenzoic acid--CoA ligase